MIKRLRRTAPRSVKAAISSMQPALKRLAYAWCHDHDRAADLVQQTLLRALEQAWQLQDPDSCRVWVVRIMTNLYRDECRARHTDALSGTLPLDELALCGRDDPEADYDRHQQLRRVTHAVRQLSDEQRMTLTLVDVMGYSYAETAAALDVPVGTVMSRLSRARSRLDALLTPGRDDTNRAPRLRRVK